MIDRNFFNEASELSVIKTRIVSKYFKAWAHVILATQQRTRVFRKEGLAYVDLFSGPGKYKDGTESTPICILKIAISNDDLRSKLITIFNDADRENAEDLKRTIDELPDAKKLKHAPEVNNIEVGAELAKLFEKYKFLPTFLFLDPWGYKGLSRELIASVIKDWGCDCVFFLNYNRINAALTNPAFEEHVKALFGEVRILQLRNRIKGLSPKEREATIIEELINALKEIGGTYVLPFRFKKQNSGSRTSHHLVFVSKGFKGYEIMKEIMARESSLHAQGVPSFEYNQVTKRQPLLFDLSRPIDDLEDMLLEEFAGQTLSMLQIYEKHSVGKAYIKKNYKDVLLALESKGSIKVLPEKHKKGTFADHLRVSFPAKSR